MKKPSRLLFDKYEYLAIFYAKKLFKIETLSFDRDDIFQEFRIKLYDIIVAYGHRWSEYRLGERGKPIPLVFYIRTSLNNFVYDYIQDIQKTEKSQYVLPNNFESMDYGISHTTLSTIDLENDICVIDDVDIFLNLTKDEILVVKMFISGFNFSEIGSKSGLKFATIHKIIDEKKESLKALYDDIKTSKRTEYVLFNMQD